MNKIFKFLVLLFLSIVFVYMLGPIPEYDEIVVEKPSSEHINIEDTVHEIKKRDVLNVKEGNESILKFYSDTTKTEYVLLYLHGFSASPMEGDAVASVIAKDFGMNYYAPRLYAHGLDVDNPMENFLPNEYIASAVTAVKEATAFGDKIIIMSTSTGGTLSIIAGPLQEKVAGYIMYSLNIDLFDVTSELLTRPWGKKVVEMVVGDHMTFDHYTDIQKKYWYHKYDSEALLGLKYILEEEMVNDNFKKIDKPLFLGLYYKNEEEQDQVISVAKALDFFEQINTPEASKRKVLFPTVGNHGIATDMFGKDDHLVTKETGLFLKEVLGMSMVE